MLDNPNCLALLTLHLLKKEALHSQTQLYINQIPLCSISNCKFLMFLHKNQLNSRFQTIPQVTRHPFFFWVFVSIFYTTILIVKPPRWGHSLNTATNKYRDYLLWQSSLLLYLDDIHSQPRSQTDCIESLAISLPICVTMLRV